MNPEHLIQMRMDESLKAREHFLTCATEVNKHAEYESMERDLKKGGPQPTMRMVQGFFDGRRAREALREAAIDLMIADALEVDARRAWADYQLAQQESR